MLSTFLQLITFAVVATSTPLFRRTASTADSGRNTIVSMEIHESCNATEVRQLRKAFQDTYDLVTVARDYILENGHDDHVYRKYFGSSEPYVVVGAYESIAHESKAGVLFRCDNIDGNCAMEGWAGHWRGDNATLETVICPLSFEARKYNEQVCALGYTVASHPTNYLFSSDILHRLSHIPTVGHGLLDHHADSYEDCLTLAQNNATWAPFNTHTLQYFAADVYARVVANPGVGCSGEVVHDDDHDHGHDLPASSSASSGAVSTSTASSGAPSSAIATVTPAPTATGAPQDCHTHADGTIHCV